MVVLNNIPVVGVMTESALPEGGAGCGVLAAGGTAPLTFPEPSAIVLASTIRAAGNQPPVTKEMLAKLLFFVLYFYYV